MKTNNIALVASLIAAVFMVGCASNGGPAETTIEPMKNVGPLTVKKTKTEIRDGKTTKVDIEETEESPESAQVRLREAELRSRNAGNKGGIFRRGGDRPDYYWQSQIHHGSGPVPPIGGYNPPSGGGGYYGGTRP